MGTIRLGFLGNGNMGYAILKGLIDQGQLQPEFSGSPGTGQSHGMSAF